MTPMLAAPPSPGAGTNGSPPMLRISPTLGLPHRAVTETIAVIGRRGSGKTNFGVVLVEELVAARLPVVVVDPVGVWWGLRAGADGKSGGLPIVLLGGERGDVPLEPESGRVIADFLLEVGQPSVLDLSLMSSSEQLHFMADFAERLYHAKATRRDALHLVIDEADAYAPQRVNETKKGGNGPRLLGAMEALVRRGRSRGIGMTMITQRPAVLNKNVLTQAEVLVVFQLTAPQDRDAIQEWVNANADDLEQVRTFRSAMPSLARGDAYVWSPAWLKLFELVHVRKRRTFDSSRTPEPGERTIAPRELAPVDLEALKQRIADTMERAEADDPEVLRRRIAELERELAAARADAKVVEVVPRAVLDGAVRVRQLFAELDGAAKGIIAAAGDDRPLTFLTDDTTSSEGSRHAPQDSARRPRALEGAGPTPAATTEHAPLGAGEKMDGGVRKILTALAQRGRAVEKAELALMTGYTMRGGRFQNILGMARTRGWVGGAGELVITPDGRRALGAYVKLPSGRAILEYWIRELGKSEGSVLAELVAVYPRKLSKEALAGRAGYEARGGRFQNILGRLRTLKLAEGKREIGLSRELAAAAGLG